jgi:hypothetical protein
MRSRDTAAHVHASYDADDSSVTTFLRGEATAGGLASVAS